MHRALCGEPAIRTSVVLARSEALDEVVDGLPRGRAMLASTLARRALSALWRTKERDRVAAPPDPILVYHFTHIRNLPGIIEGGLRSDAVCRRDGLTQVEVGSAGIRERRLQLPVGDLGPGGYVGDYVPWYFGPRSPMMFTLSRNNYEYQQGFDEVVYLVSSVPRIIALGGQWVAADRNAALSLAEFTDSPAALPGHISWDVIEARYWTDFADGADLRAAEFLVRDTVPWEAVDAIVTKTEATRCMVEEMLRGLRHTPPVTVGRQWYF